MKLEATKMNVNKFFEIILATVKQFYGEQFDKLGQEEKQAVIMKFASDLFGQNKEILDAVATSAYIELKYN